MEWVIFAMLCVAFIGVLMLMDNVFGEENARRRRIRRMERTQDHALHEAEDLIVFDQTLTREALMRTWREI